MGPQFFETPAGRKFFGADLPKLIKAIEENTAELKRANDLKERMITDREIVECIEDKIAEYVQMIIPINEEGVDNGNKG